MGPHSEAKQLRHDVFLNAGRDKYNCHSPANTRGFALPCTLGPVSFGVSSSSGNESLPPCPKSKLVAEENDTAAMTLPGTHLEAHHFAKWCDVGIILLLARQRSSKIKILEGFKVVFPHFSQHKVTKFSFGASGLRIKAM